jgi:hypothetical protein
MNNHLERLSTIYESPSPQPEIEEKLIVYDIAAPAPSKSSPIDRTPPVACFQPCPNLTNTLTTSRQYGATTNTDENPSSLPVITPLSFPSKQHVRTMKVIQSSSSSLSDFISSTPISTKQEERKSSLTRGSILTNGLLLSHCGSHPTPRRTHEKQLQSDPSSSSSSSPSSSSSSDNLSSSDEKLLSRSEFILQHEENISPKRKSSSLKSISMASPQSLSRIVYPIHFEINHSPSSKVPTSDSGIVIDKSSIEEIAEYSFLDQYETNYRKTLNDLHVIKQHIVDIESRLNEAMREVNDLFLIY